MGIKFVVHQNAGKSPVDKTCDSLKRKVQQLIKKKYFDLNLTHLSEMLVSEVIELTKPSMLDLEFQKKLEVLELAEQLGNVSEASRLSGVSRDTIYRQRRLIKEGGLQALKRQINEEHVHANRTDQETTDAIIEYSLNNPHLGQVEVSNYLNKSNHVDISAGGVRSVLLRENMQTMDFRLQKKSELQELL